MENLTVLIVDDDKITTAILSKMLAPFSNDVIIANDGFEGIRQFKAHRPDIVLSDINMPNMSGLEMVEAIRKIDTNVKIAIFTTFERPAMLIKAIRVGVNQFFSKPFEVKHFSRVIQHLCDDVLANRKIRDELDRQQDIMRAINAMATGFLNYPDWNEALHGEMLRLKIAARVSAIFIYRNDSVDDPQQAFKVVDINSNPKSRARKALHYRRHHIVRWKNSLQKGKAVNGGIDDYDRAKQKLLRTFRIDTLMLLPIFVKQKWWGFLGLGNDQRRALKPGDLEMLGTAASIIGSALDSQRHLQSLQMSSAVFNHTVDGVLITDADNKIIRINDAFSDITGYAPDEVVGRDPKLLKSGQHDKHFYNQMWQKIEEEGYWQGEITNRKKNGEIYIEWLSINAIIDTQGKTEKYIGIFSDVTHQRKNAQNHAYLATHDPLTGLSNRLLLCDRLEHAIAHAKRFNQCVAVLFCDLDNFKPINDTYGHAVGDEVLKTVAQRLKGLLRKEDTVCRYGGDEFVIVAEELKSFTHLDGIVQKINASSREPVRVGETELDVRMSIGVALYPCDADDAHALMKQADEAMYRAKRNGKNDFAYFQHDTDVYCSAAYVI